MLNQSGITKVSATAEKTIIMAPELMFAVSCVVANTGLVADSDGKKIVKAGTPLVGSLTARNTPFTAAKADTASGVCGVLLHDVDVTSGNKNATAVVFGFIDKSKLDSDVVTIVNGVATQLTKITFVQ